MTGEEAKEILGLAGKGREIGNVRLIVHIAICMANDVGAPRLEPISRSSILVEPGTSGDRATPPLGDSESSNSVGKDPKEGEKGIVDCIYVCIEPYNNSRVDPEVSESEGKYFPNKRKKKSKKFLKPKRTV